MLSEMYYVYNEKYFAHMHIFYFPPSRDVLDSNFAFGLLMCNFRGISLLE